jgi:ABC-type transport system involved in multi-copper enzyme maturation permease subunit
MIFDNNGSFLLALFQFFLFVAYLMCLFWIFGDIFRSKDLGGWGKFFWILFIIIVPLIGMLVYVIARGGGMQERQLEAVKEAQAAQMEYAKTLVGTQGGAAGPSATDQIAQAKQLLDAGTITQAEFDQIKAKALS